MSIMPIDVFGRGQTQMAEVQPGSPVVIEAAARKALRDLAVLRLERGVGLIRNDQSLTSAEQWVRLGLESLAQLATIPVTK